MAKPLNNPVEYLLDRLDKRPSRLLIALAGLPGSGKSTVAGHWVASINRRLGAGSAAALGMDGFHLTKAQLAQMPDPERALRRRGAPWTFDAAGFANKVGALRSNAGTPLRWPDFSHAAGDPVPDAITVAADCRLVIVEGLYLLHREGEWQALEHCFDECWYLDVPLETALARLLDRHQRVWQISRQQAEDHIAANDRKNARVVEASRDRARWLVS